MTFRHALLPAALVVAAFGLLFFMEPPPDGVNTVPIRPWRTSPAEPPATGSATTAPASSSTNATAATVAPGTPPAGAAATTAAALEAPSPLVIREPKTLTAEETAHRNSLRPRTPPPKEPLRVPPGKVLRLMVKLQDDLEARATSDGRLAVATAEPARVSDLERISREWGLRFEPVHTVPEADLKNLQRRAATASGQAQPDMGSLVFAVPAQSTAGNVVKVARELHALAVVEYAELESVDQPVPPPATDIAPPTPSLTHLQTYRQAATGVNVDYVWNTFGIRGDPGLRVTDCEYQYNPTHEDLDGLVIFQTGIASMYTGFGDDHATAVLGILTAGNNSYGMTGSLPECTTYFYPEFSTKTGGGTQSRPATVVAAIAASQAGDIVVLEMQSYGVGTGTPYVPAEYDLSVWNAVKTGSDAGILVVAAAGNGNQDLNAAAYDAYRNRGDSGAIIVGAGSSARVRSSFSTYGTRVNVQGWGGSVPTIGYGTYATYGSDPNQEYSNSFSGTSSATPVVTSAVGLLQSFAIKVLERRLTPAEVRQNLVATGRAQTGDLTRPIGPLPELQAAVTALLAASPPTFQDTDSWGYYHFATGQPDLTADPDGNGLPNLLEYVLGSDPKLNTPADVTLIPRLIVEPGAVTNTLVFTFPQPASRTGATWVVQGSTSLAGGSWQNLVHGTDGVSIVRIGGEVQVRVPENTSGGKRFFRLSATSSG